jgi:hypothetical protein
MKNNKRKNRNTNPKNPHHQDFIYREVIEYIKQQGWIIEFQGSAANRWVTFFTPLNSNGKPLYDDNMIFMYSITRDKLHIILAADQSTNTAIMHHQFSSPEKFEFLMNTLIHTPEQFPLPDYTKMKLSEL